MIKLCKAENRNLFENKYIRINALNDDNSISDFAFIDDVAVNGQGTYQKVIKESGYLILLPLMNNIRLNMNGFNWKIEVNQSFIYFKCKFSYFFNVVIHEHWKIQVWCNGYVISTKHFSATFLCVVYIPNNITSIR